MRLRLALPLLLATVFASCARKAVPVTSRPPVRDVAVEEIDFEYLHGRAQLNLKDENKDVEVKAHIRVRKDSVIWMTFSVMGVQGGKALINQDSITVVNTVKKEYYVFTYPDLSQRFGFQVTFPMIQSAMLGNLIYAKSDRDEVTEDETYDYIRQNMGGLLVTNAVNKLNRKVEKVDMKQETAKNALRLEYSDFQPLGSKSFPYKGAIRVAYVPVSGSEERTTAIVFEYVKAEVGDRQLNFPFNIPRRYERH